MCLTTKGPAVLCLPSPSVNDRLPAVEVVAIGGSIQGQGGIQLYLLDTTPTEPVLTMSIDDATWSGARR